MIKIDYMLQLHTKIGALRSWTRSIYNAFSSAFLTFRSEAEDKIKQAYTNFYFKVLHFYFKTKNAVNSYEYHILTIATILSYFVWYACTKDMDESCWITCLTIFIIVVSYFGLKQFVYRGFKLTGSDKKWNWHGKYLSPDKELPACRLNTDTIPPQRFRMATEADAFRTALINTIAYSDSLWCDTVRGKEKRNLEHIQRNPNSILLIKSRHNGYIGFTHIFPVSERVWQKYMQGKLGDKNFSYLNICPLDIIDTPDKKPYGFILFSVADISTDREFGHSDQSAQSEEIGDLLEQAVAYHLSVHIKHYYGDSPAFVRVLMQNLDDRYTSFFKKCNADMSSVSADGNPIISFEVAANLYVKSHCA